jgi:Asp-tRNA(Asn)/Glu-tRNA(Gln) amidotransferase A subunit family amidase
MFPEKNYRYEAEKREIRYGSLPASEIFGMTRQVLDILAYAEISGNISRYDGIKFGYHASNYKDLDDLYIKNRTEGFGLETKLAAVMGCLILSRDYYVKYYEKAMKIRRLIRESLHFDQYDIISIPVDDPLAVLVGLPSLSFSHNGTGVQLAADIKKENLLLTAWEAR